MRRSGAGGWTHSPVPWATALPATASGWGGLLGSLELRPTGCGEPIHKDGLSHWPCVWLGGVHVRPGCPAQPLADRSPTHSSVGTFLLTHPCALRRRACGTWYLGPFPVDLGIWRSDCCRALARGPCPLRRGSQQRRACFSCLPRQGQWWR